MPKTETFVDTLVEILVKARLVTSEEARIYRDQFEQSEHELFDYFLISEGLVTKEDLLRALSLYYQVPSVDVLGYYIDPVLIRNFPKDFLIVNEIIPLEMEDDFLVVAAVDPQDPTLLSKLGKFTSEDIQFQVGLAREIIDTIEDYYDKSVTEVPEDVDLDQEREEQEAFEKEGQLYEDEED